MGRGRTARIRWLASTVCWLGVGLLPTASDSGAQVVCAAAPKSDAEIAEIIATARLSRSDLPSPYANFRYRVRRRSCHYVYLESEVPASAGSHRSFLLNQDGVIVDVEYGF